MELITIGFIIIVAALFAVKTVPYMRDNKSKVLTAAGSDLSVAASVRISQTG